jgi:hypothetical protein
MTKRRTNFVVQRTVLQYQVDYNTDVATVLLFSVLLLTPSISEVDTRSTLASWLTRRNKTIGVPWINSSVLCS